MYSFVIASCVMFSTIEPINKCMAEKSDMRFHSYETCERVAMEEKKRLFYYLKSEYPKHGIVIDAPCFK